MNLPPEESLWDDIPESIATMYHPRVIACREHPSGAFLVIRAMSTEVYLYWFPKKSYMFKPVEIGGFCEEFSTLEMNLAAAMTYGNELMLKDPPPDVLAIAKAAKASREARSEARYQKSLNGGRKPKDD